jgi:hypothetical protein
MLRILLSAEQLLTAQTQACEGEYYPGRGRQNLDFKKTSVVPSRYCTPWPEGLPISSTTIFLAKNSRMRLQGAVGDLRQVLSANLKSLTCFCLGLSDL